MPCYYAVRERKMDNIFYHYSVERYDVLKSQVLQGKIPRDNNPMQYGKNISLFFEPIPLNLPEILHNAHDFWRSGNRVWCHEILAKDIPSNIIYKVTESPEKTELLYQKQDWSKVINSPETKDRYLAEIRLMEEKHKYVGKGRVEFLRASERFRSGIEGYYRAMYELHLKNPEDKLIEKYAACVPHAMIYPDMTPLRVSKSYMVVFQ